MRDTSVRAHVHLNECKAEIRDLGGDPAHPYITIDLGSSSGAIFVNPPAFDCMREVVRLINVLEAT